MMNSFPSPFGLLLLNITREAVIGAMKMIDLLNLIYGERPAMARCRDCWRPMVLREDERGKYLWCKHCEDLRKEEGER